MTHGHELRWGGTAGGNGSTRWRRDKGRKKWDNGNSIINKMYLTKRTLCSNKMAS